MASAMPWAWDLVDRVRFCGLLLSQLDRQGFVTPLPYRFKRGMIQRAMRELGLRALVETGTYLGDTPWYFRLRLPRIHTIEVGDVLFEEARRRFARWPNVTVHHGDSAKVLASLVPTLDSPTLFWLDGHFDGGITGRGDLDCPIFAELEAILGSMKSRWAVLIDDARSFGHGDYPSLDVLRSFVAARRPDFSMWVENDVIWLVPEAGMDSLPSRAAGRLCSGPAAT
jgi:hypothetical protein